MPPKKNGNRFARGGKKGIAAPGGRTTTAPHSGSRGASHPSQIPHFHDDDEDDYDDEDDVILTLRSSCPLLGSVDFSVLDSKIS